MVDWTELPRDLLLLIAKYLGTPFDFLNFRSVCTNWRASVPSNFRPRTFRPPFRFQTHEWGALFFIWERSVCLFEFPADHNRTAPRFWLVSLEEDEYGRKHIIDPLYIGKPMQIPYPMVLDMSKFRIQELVRQYLHMTVIDIGLRSYDLVAYMNIDDEDDFIVLGKYNGHVNVFKHRGEELSKIKVEGFSFCWDCILFEGKFYAVDYLGNTCFIEPFSEAYFPLAKASTLGRGYKVLIQFCQNLLLVELVRINRSTRTFRFEVFQLDKERKRWDRLESLGEGILFFGKHCKFSAPVIPGVKGNCIVFCCQVAGATVRDENGKILPKALVFDISSGITVPVDDRPDLFQLLRPPSFLSSPSSMF